MFDLVASKFFKTTNLTKVKLGSRQIELWRKEPYKSIMMDVHISKYESILETQGKCYIYLNKKYKLVFLIIIYKLAYLIIISYAWP